MADDLHFAAVVGQPHGEPVAGQHVQPSTSTPAARPTGVTAQLTGDLLRPAAVVGQLVGHAGAGQHLPTATSPATAQDARPGGITALVDELLRPAAVVGQHDGQAAAGQHPHTAASPATAQDARPGGESALVNELLRPAAVVGQHVGQALAGQHPHTARSPATAQDARPGGVSALVDELLLPAAVVGQHVRHAGAGQHLPTASSPATAQDARPGGVTVLVDELLRPAAVVGQHVQQAGAGQHPHNATSPANPPLPTTGTAGAASLPVHGAMVAADPIPIPKAVESRVVEALIAQKPSFDEYLKWLEDQGQKTPVIPPTHSNQAVDQGVEAANVTAATAGPSASAVEAAVWRVVEEAGGVDEEILASIVMPDREIEVMREKLQAAAPTLGAQQGTPAASTAPAEDHSAAGAKSPPATTGEVGDGKHKRKGKDKAKGGPAKAGSSKGTSKAVAQGWKGSGVRVDASTGLATSEMKFGKKSRYICRSMDKSEAAYCIAVAVSSYDGFVSDVILDEFGGVKEDVMAQYKAEWNLARLIPGAMWTVMWTVMWRECLPRQTNATAEVAAGERGAAAIVRGASKEFAKRCKSVIEVVLQRASSRKVGVEEVADTVTKDLHGVVLRLLPEDGDERDHDDLIARVMIENLAFWGDCCVGGPKLKARGVNLPLDAGMKVIVRNRGARDQHKGKQAADA
ncbi:unnamed protein product [Closterium sp. NIES-64]|nr:unnamed protein product [Closterium sp. NIES-64]